MIITQTPLRISFAGGGTDIPDFYEKETGFVVSSAIDKYIYVIVKERFDDLIYAGREICTSVDEIQHELILEAMRKTGITFGIEIMVFADIPSEGSGLGSSSSLTVGLLNAMYTHQGEQVTAERLAREACEIEIDICKKPIGKQDQYIAAFGNLRAFTFNKDGTVEVEKLALTHRERLILGSTLLIFYTNITRSANPILAAQKEQLPYRMDELRYIKELAHHARESIQTRQFEVIGAALEENWRLKCRLADGISNAEIDQIVETALKASAQGCKIVGAGGGGFLLVYCERERQNELRHAMQAYRELPFQLEPDGSKVIFNQRRYVWR